MGLAIVFNWTSDVTDLILAYQKREALLQAEIDRLKLIRDERKARRKLASRSLQRGQ